MVLNRSGCDSIWRVWLVARAGLDLGRGLRGSLAPPPVDRSHQPLLSQSKYACLRTLHCVARLFDQLIHVMEPDGNYLS